MYLYTLGVSSLTAVYVYQHACSIARFVAFTDNHKGCNGVIGQLIIKLACRPCQINWDYVVEVSGNLCKGQNMHKQHGLVMFLLT